MPDSLLVGINKLTLQPGDVLVVTVPGSTMADHIERVGEQIKRHLPAGVQVMVNPAYVDVTVLRAGQPVEPEVDEATVVEVSR